MLKGASPHQLVKDIQAVLSEPALQAQRRRASSTYSNNHALLEQLRSALFAYGHHIRGKVKMSREVHQAISTCANELADAVVDLRECTLGRISNSELLICFAEMSELLNSVTAVQRAQTWLDWFYVCSN
jgi:hypothetical protein